MAAKKGVKWVKVKILKHMISVYGSHFPDAIITIPERVAKNWAQNGIAVAVDDAGNEIALEPEKPKVIPAGMFWCSKHATLHKLTSSQGKKCLKRQTKEDENAAKEEEAEAMAAEEEEAERAMAQAEAEEKARQEAVELEGTEGDGEEINTGEEE